MAANLFQSKIFQRYLLPGFVFQSIIIAGGYGTGRELVEFFLRYGPLGGLLGMLLIATVVMSVTAAASFEFARVFQTFDYRAFFVQLLGRAWFLYEVFFLPRTSPEPLLRPEEAPGEPRGRRPRFRGGHGDSYPMPRDSRYF